MTPLGFESKVSFVWRVADKLRGTFKQHEYGSVMLPLLVLRRMDAVLAPTKDAVLALAATMSDIGPGQDMMLKAIAGQRFYNTSPLSFTSMLSDDKNLGDALAGYVRRLSADAYAVMEAYSLDDKIARMDRAGILYAVLSDFADLNVGPSVVSNEAMGYVFEELLRKFSEMSNETAGEHYTPREVITLMVELLLGEQTSSELTQNPKPVRTVYDPAAGTGGMLMGALHQITERNPAAVVQVYGQELNNETWAIAQSDLMMQDIDPKQMSNGNSLTADAFATDHFDFILANPPYGVDWKGYAAAIKDEHSRLGHAGRFGAGLPRVSDGSLLFLQHMLSKMKPGGSRVGIVLSGSPLFSGQAGSGESEIRRWILENDWLEGIVALPDQMFYNTGISTYVWMLTNNKADADRGRVSSSTAGGWAQRCASRSATSARNSPPTRLRRSRSCTAVRLRSSPTTLAFGCSTARRSASSGSPSSGRSSTTTASRCSRRASPSPTPNFATPRTCRCPPASSTLLTESAPRCYEKPQSST